MIYELVFGGSWVQTCMVGLLTAMLVYWIIQKRKYKLPPGPFALPLIGHYLQLDNKFMHEKIFKEWTKKYGPVVTLRVGPIKTVFVNSLETAMEVLVQKSTDFAGRSSSPSIDALSDKGKDIALGQYSPTWKLQRKIASSALRRYMQGSALENRVHQALETGFKEIEKETGPFNPKKYLNYIIGNILVGLCFGGEYDFNSSEVNRVMKLEDDLNDVFSKGALEDYIPGLRFLYKTQSFKQMEDINGELMDFMRRKFYGEEKTFDIENIRHFTDCLFVARTEYKNEDGAQLLTDSHLVMTLADIFFAGIDTTRFTLAFAITHMMAFPDIQAKVQEEIDRVVGRDRLPGMSDRPELGYTEAVLHESMRYTTVAPIGLPHMALCDSEIAGYQIPKGTTVIVNQWALHNDPELWEEPDRFIPERFLDENGHMGPKPPGWLPFSAGKRVCLGEFVAKPEMHLIFAALMQRFEWRCQSGYQADLIPGGTSLGIFPKDFKTVITKRIP